MIVLQDTHIHASDSMVVAKVFQDLLAGEDALDQEKEHYYVMHVDTRNSIKMVELVALGTVNSALVHPRETYRRAMSVGSVSLIIAHNHPSADVTPSEQDVNITQKLFQAGEILDIQLLDHIIFSLDTYYSMKENKKGGDYL